MPHQGTVSQPLLLHHCTAVVRLGIVVEMQCPVVSQIGYDLNTIWKTMLRDDHFKAPRGNVGIAHLHFPRSMDNLRAKPKMEAPVQQFMRLMNSSLRWASVCAIGCRDLVIHQGPSPMQQIPFCFHWAGVRDKLCPMEGNFFAGPPTAHGARCTARPVTSGGTHQNETLSSPKHRDRDPGLSPIGQPVKGLDVGDATTHFVRMLMHFWKKPGQSGFGLPLGPLAPQRGCFGDIAMATPCSEAKGR